jgi:ribosomal protein S27AE
MAANSPMICPKCGIAMNHHSDKLAYSTGSSDSAYGEGVVIVELHTCPECGSGAGREA